MWKKLLLFERNWDLFVCLVTKQNKKIQSLQPLGSFYRLDLTNWWYNQLRLLIAIGLWSVLLPWRGDCHSEETLSKRIVTRERCFVFSSRHERGTKKKMLSAHEESNLRPSDSALRCIVIVTVKIFGCDLEYEEDYFLYFSRTLSENFKPRNRSNLIFLHSLKNKVIFNKTN